MTEGDHWVIADDDAKCLMGSQFQRFVVLPIAILPTASSLSNAYNAPWVVGWHISPLAHKRCWLSDSSVSRTSCWLASVLGFGHKSTSRRVYGQLFVDSFFKHNSSSLCLCSCLFYAFRVLCESGLKNSQLFNLWASFESSCVLNSFLFRFLFVEVLCAVRESQPFR